MTARRKNKSLETDDEIEAILAENTRRHGMINAVFNPVTGEGYREA